MKIANCRSDVSIENLKETISETLKKYKVNRHRIKSMAVFLCRKSEFLPNLS